MGLLTYPPDQHQTDSKTIFFIGHAKESCSINDEAIELSASGNFSKVVKLKLGDNKFKCKLDGELIERTIVGIRADEPNPVAYGQHYDAFPPASPSKQNILRSIIVDDNRIEVPLNIAPMYQLEKHGKYKYYLDLSDIEMDLDWIHYRSPDSAITIGDVRKSKIPIIFSKPVSIIHEHWENNSLVLDISYHEQDFKVCIDPGHGGSSCGTCSPKGIKEKDLNLSFAQLLNAELSQLGVDTIMTRDEDEELSLEERVNYANEEDALLFISIHHNALPDARDPQLEHGASCHYYHEQSKGFASYLLNKITDKTELDYAGLFRQNLYVLRENPDCISVLVELGFLIHPTESDLIASQEFQKSTASVMANTILEYFVDKA